jgi:hypothetical protein
MAESLARCEAGRRYLPTEKLMFKGAGAPEQGVITAHDVDPGEPLGAWKGHGLRRRTKLVSSAGFMICDPISFQR